MKSLKTFRLSALMATTISAGLALSLGCSSKSDEGRSSSSPVPSTVQIVKAVLPSSLESSAVPFDGASTQSLIDFNLQELKNRIFSPGPTDFLYRLKMIDSRLAEVGSMVSSCESTSTQTYTPPAVVSGMFSLKFSCKATLTGQGGDNITLYFGNDGTYWYIGEFFTNSGFLSGSAEPPSLATLAKIDDAGLNLDVYQISVEYKSSTNYATVTHIIADKSSGEFQVSTASSADSTQTISPGANFTGLGCGVTMRTNSTLVYASGKFSQNATCPSAATVCANGADLSAGTGCTGVVDTFTISELARASVNGNTAKSMIIDRSGLPTL